VSVGLGFVKMRGPAPVRKVSPRFALLQVCNPQLQNAHKDKARKLQERMWGMLQLSKCSSAPWSLDWRVRRTALDRTGLGQVPLEG